MEMSKPSVSCSSRSHCPCSRWPARSPRARLALACARALAQCTLACALRARARLWVLSMQCRCADRRRRLPCRRPLAAVPPCRGAGYCATAARAAAGARPLAGVPRPLAGRRNCRRGCAARRGGAATNDVCLRTRQCHSSGRSRRHCKGPRQRCRRHGAFDGPVHSFI